LTTLFNGIIRLLTAGVLARLIQLPWKKVMLTILLAYFALGCFTYYCSDLLLFRPPASSYTDSDNILKLVTPSGIQISAQYLPNPIATYTILFSHGNAEDLGKIRSTLKIIHDVGFAVFAYDYQGYGTSQGNPSEQNFYQDIETAYAYVTQTLGIPPTQIILQGRSIGVGPAIALVAHTPVAGLIVESGFTSAFTAMTQISIFPFDKFPNLDRIRQVRHPVLVIHGTADRLIPFCNGQRLYRAAHGPKQFFAVVGAGHSDIIEKSGVRYVQTLQAFAQKIAADQLEHSVLPSVKAVKQHPALSDRDE
jgi:abhydrolase domain-containing protein 17